MKSMPDFALAAVATPPWVQAPETGCPGVWAAEGVHGEKWPRRGQFLPDLKADSPAIGQKASEKWTGAATLQRTFLLPPGLLK
ncbi:MAG: hypothetical protein V4731_04355 [Pseudomonadota bacterium]